MSHERSINDLLTNGAVAIKIRDAALKATILATRKAWQDTKPPEPKEGEQRQPHKYGTQKAMIFLQLIKYVCDAVAAAIKLHTEKAQQGFPAGIVDPGNVAAGPQITDALRTVYET